MEKLAKSFYKKYGTIELSKKLLGKQLVHITESGRISGKIVETEAYLFNDPAAHSFIGKTERNKSVFEEAGVSYVYFIYGMYFCFNVSSNDKDVGEAVLIRALEPIEGIALMRKNLSSKKDYSNVGIKDLCNGPGKLCKALDITRKEDGIKLWNSNELYIVDADVIDEKDIVISKRVGIAKAVEQPFRFYIKDNKFISKA